MKENQNLNQNDEKRYRKWNEKSIKKFILFKIQDNNKDLTEEEKEKIWKNINEEIKKLIKIQGINYDCIKFLGQGQRFWTISVGDAVIKIENKISESSKVLEVPYRINPKYQKTLYQKSDGSGIDLYISQKAETKGITLRDVQEMYNIIRRNGGIWLDVKEENLGFYDKEKIDFKKYYGKPKNFKLHRKINSYSGNIYIIDYEDVVFLDPKMIKNSRENGKYTGYGILGDGNVYLPYISIEALDKKNLDDIYFEAYIKNSKTLLEFEKNYQKEKGNLKAVKKCETEEKKIQEKRKRRERKIEFLNKIKYKNQKSSDIEEDIDEIEFELEDKAMLKSKKRKITTENEEYETQKINDDPYKTPKIIDNDDPYKTR